MKSEGVKDVVKWLKAEIKVRQAAVKEAEADLRRWCGLDCGDTYERRLRIEEALLAQLISVKISTEKFMKKLQHEEAGR